MAKKHVDNRKARPKVPGMPMASKACVTSHGRLDKLYQQGREILEQARATAARSVNSEMVRAYWLVGRKVVEEEQNGSARADYGDELINHLSARLRADFGRGFTPSNLRDASPVLSGVSEASREIHHAVRDKSERGDLNEPAIVDREPRRGMLNPDLSWTHYRLLTKVESSQGAIFTRSKPSATTGRRASSSARWDRNTDAAR